MLRGALRGLREELFAGSAEHAALNDPQACASPPVVVSLILDALHSALAADVTVGLRISSQGASSDDRASLGPFSRG